MFQVYLGSLQDRYPKLWEQCKNIIRKEMLEKGWCKYARKFDEVLRKRAFKLMQNKLNVHH